MALTCVCVCDLCVCVCCYLKDRETFGAVSLENNIPLLSLFLHTFSLPPCAALLCSPHFLEVRQPMASSLPAVHQRIIFLARSLLHPTPLLHPSPQCTDWPFVTHAAHHDSEPRGLHPCKVVNPGLQCCSWCARGVSNDDVSYCLLSLKLVCQFLMLVQVHSCGH